MEEYCSIEIENCPFIVCLQ